MPDEQKSQVKGGVHKAQKGHAPEGDAHKGDSDEGDAHEDYGTKMREKIADRLSRKIESA